MDGDKNTRTRRENELNCRKQPKALWLKRKQWAAMVWELQGCPLHPEGISRQASKSR